MIPVLKPEMPEDYWAQRDKAASDVIFARMEQILRGRKNQDAETDYDSFKHGLRRGA